MISIEEFGKLDLRVGTVLVVRLNRKSRNPAYAMTIDFGELGVRKTSAQITVLYTPDELIGSQVICCVNLPHLYIGLVKSEVRVIASEPESGIVLIRPDRPVETGDPCIDKPFSYRAALDRLIVLVLYNVNMNSHSHNDRRRDVSPLPRETFFNLERKSSSAFWTPRCVRSRRTATTRRASPAS